MSTKSVTFTDDSGLMAVTVDSGGNVEFTYEGSHLLTVDNGHTAPSRVAMYEIKEIIDNAIEELENRA